LIHDDLVKTILGGHTAIIGVAILAVCTISWPFKSIIEGGKEVLTEIKRKITEELAAELKDVFGSNSEVRKVGMVVGPDGEKWNEERVSPFESEQFGNALFYFVENNSDAIRNYVLFKNLIKTCIYWNGYFAVSLFMLIIVQLILIGIIWGVDIIYGFLLPDNAIKWSIAISAIAIVNCMLGFAKLLLGYIRSLKFREMYE